MADDNITSKEGLEQQRDAALTQSQRELADRLNRESDRNSRIRGETPTAGEKARTAADQQREIDEENRQIDLKNQAIDLINAENERQGQADRVSLHAETAVARQRRIDNARALDRARQQNDDEGLIGASQAVDARERERNHEEALRREREGVQQGPTLAGRPLNEEIALRRPETAVERQRRIEGLKPVSAAQATPAKPTDSEKVSSEVAKLKRKVEQNTADDAKRPVIAANPKAPKLPTKEQATKERQERDQQQRDKLGRFIGGLADKLSSASAVAKPAKGPSVAEREAAQAKKDNEERERREAAQQRQAETVARVAAAKKAEEERRQKAADAKAAATKTPTATPTPKPTGKPKPTTTTRPEPVPSPSIARGGSTAQPSAAAPPGKPPSPKATPSQVTPGGVTKSSESAKARAQVAAPLERPPRPVAGAQPTTPPTNRLPAPVRPAGPPSTRALPTRTEPKPAPVAKVQPAQPLKRGTSAVAQPRPSKPATNLLPEPKRAAGGGIAQVRPASAADLAAERSASGEARVATARALGQAAAARQQGRARTQERLQAITTTQERVRELDKQLQAPSPPSPQAQARAQSGNEQVDLRGAELLRDLESTAARLLGRQLTAAEKARLAEGQGLGSVVTTIRQPDKATTAEERERSKGLTSTGRPLIAGEHSFPGGAKARPEPVSKQNRTPNMPEGRGYVQEPTRGPDPYSKEAERIREKVRKGEPLTADERFAVQGGESQTALDVGLAAFPVERVLAPVVRPLARPIAKAAREFFAEAAGTGERVAVDAASQRFLVERGKALAIVESKPTSGLRTLIDGTEDALAGLKTRTVEGAYSSGATEAAEDAAIKYGRAQASARAASQSLNELDKANAELVEASQRALRGLSNKEEGRIFLDELVSQAERGYKGAELVERTRQATGIRVTKEELALLTDAGEATARTSRAVKRSGDALQAFSRDLDEAGLGGEAFGALGKEFSAEHERIAKDIAKAAAERQLTPAELQRLLREGQVTKEQFEVVTKKGGEFVEAGQKPPPNFGAKPPERPGVPQDLGSPRGSLATELRRSGKLQGSGRSAGVGSPARNLRPGVPATVIGRGVPLSGAPANTPDSVIPPVTTPNTTPPEPDVIRYNPEQFPDTGSRPAEQNKPGLQDQDKSDKQSDQDKDTGSKNDTQGKTGTNPETGGDTDVRPDVQPKTETQPEQKPQIKSRTLTQTKLNDRRQQPERGPGVRVPIARPSNEDGREGRFARVVEWTQGVERAQYDLDSRLLTFRLATAAERGKTPRESFEITRYDDTAPQKGTFNLGVFKLTVGDQDVSFQQRRPVPSLVDKKSLRDRRKVFVEERRKDPFAPKRKPKAPVQDTTLKVKKAKDSTLVDRQVSRGRPFRSSIGRGQRDTTFSRR